MRLVRAMITVFGDVNMLRNSLIFVLAAVMSLFMMVAGARVEDSNSKTEPGSDFLHPIFLCLDLKQPTDNCLMRPVKGVGDATIRPDVYYMLRLIKGQKLTATLSSESTNALSQNTVALSLVNGSATSLQDAVRLARQIAVVDRKQSPAKTTANIVYVAPATADYFLVAEFHAGGILFQVDANAIRSDFPSPKDCATGGISELDFFSNDIPNNLISYVTIGDPTRADHPDDHNRRFCLTTCEIRPPTSLVLTTELKETFKLKKEITACWDDFSKTIVQVTSP